MTPHGHWGPPVDDRPPVAPEDAGFRERLRLLWDDSRRRLRGTGDRGRKVRGLAALLRPYRTRDDPRASSRSPSASPRRSRRRRSPPPRSTRASSRATSRR